MHRIIAFAILFFVFPAIASYGQGESKLDSLVQLRKTLPDSQEKIEVLAALYNLVLYSDSDLAKKYAWEELQMSRKIGFKEGIALSQYHLGVYFNNISDFDTAKHYYGASKQLFQELNNIEKVLTVNHALAILEYYQGHYDESVAILRSNIVIHSEQEYDSADREKALNFALAYDLLGQVELFRGNYNLALQETLKALKVLEVIDKPIRKADALNHLGAVEFSLNNYNNCIKYNRQALEIYEKFNDKYYAAQVLNDVGNTYYYMGELDSALVHLQRSIALSREMNTGDLLGTALNNLGKVYAKQERFGKAIEFSGDALKIHEEAGSKNKVVESLNDLGMIYNDMDQPEKAIPFFDRAIAIAGEIETKENQRIGFFNRSRSYELLNNLNRALKDYKAYKATEDSIFSETKSRQIEELRTIYSMERKEKEIELQRSEIQLLSEKEKVTALQRTILAIGFVVVVAVLGLGYYGVRQKLKRNKLAKEKLDVELEFKRKELTSHALHLANKNKVLEDLKAQIDTLRTDNGNGRGYNRIINTINFNLNEDSNWRNFTRYFEEVHKDFNSNVKDKYPAITSNELRLMALLKMNLSSKEIANILNISSEGIKKARYRLRKKLNIGSDDSLQDLIISM